MKLYSMVPHDSAGKVRWLLLELGLDFEDQKVSYRNGDLKQESFLAKHPLGQVPVLEDGATTIYESYAIIAYLADKHVEKGLAPDPRDSALRAAYYQWLFFSANSVEGFFSRLQMLPETSESYKAEWGEYLLEKTRMVLGAIEKQLSGRSYVLGAFSAVDTCLGYALGAVADEPFFQEYPLTNAYLTRLKQREACVRSGIFKS